MRITPCHSRIVRLGRTEGVFSPPPTNQPINIRYKSGEEPPGYVVVEEVDKGPSGWTARIRGESGETRLIHNTDIKNWSHVKGLTEQDYHQWHRERLETQRRQKYEREQAGKIAEFESTYVFHDGRPLKTQPNKKTIVRINDEVQGQLELFAGENMYVDNIDHANSLVDLTPVKPELAEDPQILQEARQVPAADVVAYSVPVMKESFSNQPIRMPSGEQMTIGDLLNKTPTLNRLASEGRVTLGMPQTYVNYTNKDGMTGEQIFLAQMEAAGMDPDAMEPESDYKQNLTPAKYDDQGRRTSPLGSWEGSVYVSAPVPDELREELLMVLQEPEAQKIGKRPSQIMDRKDGSIRINNNFLFLNMVALGVKSRPQVAMASAWVASACKFAS